MSLTEPLRFRPRAFPKVWGGARLRAMPGVEAPDDGPIGEVWQLVDREGQSSEVADGPLAGRSLAGLMLSEREALLGASRPSASGHFPLLVKLIDTAEPLSVQVHPDRATAERLGSEAKDECWYVLAAEPGSELYLGLRPGVDAKTFAAEASGPAVVDLLQSFPVEPGHFVAVPAGTVHALGAGLTIVEVQENADTTYRFYDWDRCGLNGAPRPLHREEALRSVDYEQAVEGPRRPELAGDGANARAALFTADAFTVELLHVHEPLEHDTAGCAWVYVALSGHGSLALPDGRSWRVGRGETWLAPASLGAHRFEAVDGELSLLRVEARG